MGYQEEFSEVMEKLGKIRSANLFIFPNADPKKIKQLPEKVENELLKEYLSFLKNAIEGRDFAEFDATVELDESIKSSGVQVIDVAKTELWKKVLEALNEKREAGTLEHVKIEEVKGAGNVIIMEIQLSPGENVYFLTVHRNVASWYASCILFVNKTAVVALEPKKSVVKKVADFMDDDSDIRRLKGSILALTPCVAAVIHKEKCYVIDMGDFTKIFKFKDMINAQFEKHEETIGGLKFLSNGESFYAKVKNSVRWKKEMLTVIGSGRLEAIQQIDNNTIEKRITKHEEIKNQIVFNDNHQIDVENSSIGDLVGVLSDRIHIDLINDSLIGSEENNGK